MPLEPPELVTLLPEEEEKNQVVSQDLKIVRRLLFEVVVLVGCKVGMIYASHRVVKTIREMNRVNLPHQRNSK